MEDFVGKPYVYTVDLNDNNHLIAVMKEIKAAKVNQKLLNHMKRLNHIT